MIGEQQPTAEAVSTDEPVVRSATTEQPDLLRHSPERTEQLHQLMERLGLSNLENLPSELSMLREAMTQKVSATIDPANPEYVPGDIREKVALIKQAAVESKEAITKYKNDVKYGTGLMGKFRQFMAKPTAKIFAGAAATIGSVFSPIPLSIAAPALWTGGWRTMVEGIRQLTGDEGAKRRRLTEVHANFAQRIDQELDAMVADNEVDPASRAEFMKEFIEGVYIREMQTLFRAENELEEPMKARANWQNGAWKKTAFLALGLAMPMDIDGLPTALGQMKGGDFKSHFVTLFKNFWDGDASKWGSVGLLTGDNVLLKLGMAATNVAAGFGGYYLTELAIRKSEGKKVQLHEELPTRRAEPPQPTVALSTPNRPQPSPAPRRGVVSFVGGPVQKPTVTKVSTPPSTVVPPVPPSEPAKAAVTKPKTEPPKATEPPKTIPPANPIETKPPIQISNWEQKFIDAFNDGEKSTTPLNESVIAFDPDADLYQEATSQDWQKRLYDRGALNGRFFTQLKQPLGDSNEEAKLIEKAKTLSSSLERMIRENESAVAIPLTQFQDWLRQFDQVIADRETKLAGSSTSNAQQTNEIRPPGQEPNQGSATSGAAPDEPVTPPEPAITNEPPGPADAENVFKLDELRTIQEEIKDAPDADQVARVRSYFRKMTKMGRPLRLAFNKQLTAGNVTLSIDDADGKTLQLVDIEPAINAPTHDPSSPAWVTGRFKNIATNAVEDRSLESLLTTAQKVSLKVAN